MIGIYSERVGTLFALQLLIDCVAIVADGLSGAESLFPLEGPRYNEKKVCHCRCVRSELQINR